MKKWYWITDVEKCENCRNCFLACKDEYVDNDWSPYSAPQPWHGQKWIDIHTNERGQYPAIDVGYLPKPCMHCDDAPCMKAGRDNAIYKRPDGIVIIDTVKAKGQKQVVKACPYDAIWWNDKLQLPQKCTFCAHLLDDGWKTTRCAQSCPTGSLSVLHVEDSRMHEIIEAEKLEVYHPEYKSLPRVYYKNSYRFTRCFVGGSVAIRVDGREECAEGAVVTLLNSENKEVGRCVTGNYGDFKFDNLEENSGKHTLQIECKGYDARTVVVDLKKSLNAGTFYL